MNYNCFIVDDEPLAIEVIENHLGKLNHFKVVGTYTDAVEAFVAIKNQPVDLLFLDIEMPDFNGLDFIKSMKQMPEVIITTAYREFAVEGFELNILDYLVKPIAFDRFMKAVDKFLDTKKGAAHDSRYQKEYLMIRANRKLVRLNLSDILYIEGLKDYVKIILPDEMILTKESIGNFYKHLNEENFLRIHKSFIVAVDKITAITSYDVEIGKTELPIGRNYKENVMLKMHNKS
jgi:DNA-binding LytR/AlgR family response regulator